MKLVKLAVVRIRGSVDVRSEVGETLRMLSLTRPNHCVLVDDDNFRKGMLQKAKEMVTWGEIKPETLENLLEKRGRLLGGDNLTDEVVKEKTSYDTIGEYAEAICENRSSLSAIKDLKEVFRLRPPKKGFKHVKRAVSEGGAYGYRGEGINELLSRMI